MREILFRGKRLDNSGWVEGYFFQNWEQTYILWGTTNGIPNMTKVDPATIGQYTGLPDKNGKKIFEGDAFEDSRKWRAVVTWDEENARFLGVGGGFVSYIGKVPQVKVIGNATDNPELVTP